MPKPDELKQLSDALLAHVPEHGLIARVLIVVAADDKSGNVALSSNVPAEHTAQLAEAARILLKQRDERRDYAAAIARAMKAADAHGRVGCSEFWVQHQLLPALAREGLTIVGRSSV